MQMFRLIWPFIILLGERNERRRIMVYQTKKEQSGEMLNYGKEAWEQEY